jgi:hypothetical protein
LIAPGTPAQSTEDCAVNPSHGGHGRKRCAVNLESKWRRRIGDVNIHDDNDRDRVNGLICGESAVPVGCG